MRFITTLRVAFASLQSNKIRSLLAMLGIIIGIASVISMLAIGAGAQADIMGRISQMGSNLLSVRPGSESTRGVWGGQVDSLTVEDAQVILAEIPDIRAVSPIANGSAQLKYFENNVNSSVYGVATTWPSIRNYEVEFGRFFTDSEAMFRSKVVVLGSETASELGLTEADIGTDIKLRGLRFTLIGILKEKGGAGFFSADELAVIPYTTAMSIVFGLDYLSEIAISAKDDVDIANVEERVNEVLRSEHGIGFGEEDDFRVRNQADIIEAVTESSQTFTILLGAIASISLIVGGIGIMNIMLVTVTERTREIGIRKAIGAKERDILLQFLLEAIIMCIISGIFGVGLGVGASYLIEKMSDFTTLLQINGIILALIFSITVGVFFGFYPAQRAARLDPVDALSYE